MAYDWRDRGGSFDLDSEELTDLLRARPRVSPGKSATTARLIAPSRGAQVPFDAAAAWGGLLQRKEAADADVHPEAVERVQRAAAGSGAPLPDEIRDRFEVALGADLSAVRVHVSADAEVASKAVGARAYTVGNDIFFGPGEYSPESAAGQHLLAHEVAHTVQQAGTAPSAQFKLEVSQSGDAAESEADRAADAMVSGRTASVTAQGPGRLHRKPDKKDDKDKLSDEEKKRLKASLATVEAAKSQLEGACKDMHTGWKESISATKAIGAAFNDLGKLYKEAYQRHKNVLDAAKQQAEAAEKMGDAILGILTAVAVGATVGKALEAVITWKTLGAPIRDALGEVAEQGAGKALSQFTPPAAFDPSGVLPEARQVEFLTTLLELKDGLLGAAQMLVDAYANQPRVVVVRERMHSWVTGGKPDSTPAELLDSVGPILKAAGAATSAKDKVDKGYSDIVKLLGQTTALKASTSADKMERDLWIQWVADHGVDNAGSGPIIQRLRDLGLMDILGIDHDEYNSIPGLNPADERGDIQKAAQELADYQAVMGKTGQYAEGRAQIEGREYRAQVCSGPLPAGNDVVAVRVVGVSAVSSKGLPAGTRPIDKHPWDLRYRVAMLDCEVLEAEGGS